MELSEELIEMVFERVGSTFSGSDFLRELNGICPSNGFKIKDVQNALSKLRPFVKVTYSSDETGAPRRLWQQSLMLAYLIPKDQMELMQDYRIPPRVVTLQNGSRYLVYADEEGTSYARVRRKLGTDPECGRERLEIRIVTNPSEKEGVGKALALEGVFSAPYRPLGYS